MQEWCLSHHIILGQQLVHWGDAALVRIGYEESRYIILGTIDGLLAVLGIVIGTQSITSDSRIIIGASLSGAIALALTNGAGSYLAESTVEYAKIAKMERAMLRSLNDTSIERKAKKKIVAQSLVHGGSSFLGSMIPIVPLLIPPIANGPLPSIILSILTLVALGFLSGRVSKTRVIVSVAKMVGLGVAIIVACTALGIGEYAL
jgi:predicted membrane protein (TIGR00267 family)